MKKKIIVVTMGGIGNQLFQYAFGRALEIKTDSDLYIDKTWFGKDHENIYSKGRLFVLDKYYCKYRNLSGFKKYLFKLMRSTQEINFKYEKKYVYELKYLNKFIGYWQSYEYFNFIKEIIYKDIQIVNKTLAYKQVEKEIENNNYVCIHVRRGDYLENEKIKGIHGVIQLNYYIESIRILEAKFGVLKKIIFSDDQEWCRKNLLLDESFKIFETSKFNDYEELTLMAKCKYFVIANSSFSWWAAYLSGVQGSQIIAPKKWFKDSNFENQDMIPGDWIRINNSFI